MSAGQQRLGSCETLFFDYYFRSNRITELSREKINAGYQRLDSCENCVKNILQEKKHLKKPKLNL